MSKIDLRIRNGDIVYQPVIVNEVKWTTERTGTPGKLTFDVVKDGIINFQEGNEVSLYVDDKPIFFGFVFQKKRDKGERISVTAYDQLRYLKNKDVYMFEGKSATEFIQMIATDFKLNCGFICDTGYVIPQAIYDNETLFDMIQKALDETLTNTKRIFVLYDDFGKLTLKNINDMKLNYVICDSNAENYDYTTSIDGDTYNQIKLSYDNKDTGKRENYIEKSSENINNWGVLQYFEKANSNIGLQEKAKSLLQLYNKKTRVLSLKNILGHTDVLAGSGVAVGLNLGDVIVNQYFLCESVTHTFKSDIHLMDIKLKGSDFIV